MNTVSFILTNNSDSNPFGAPDTLWSNEASSVLNVEPVIVNLRWTTAELFNKAEKMFGQNEFWESFTSCMTVGSWNREKGALNTQPFGLERFPPLEIFVWTLLELLYLQLQASHQLPNLSSKPSLQSSERYPKAKSSSILAFLFLQAQSLEKMLSVQSLKGNNQAFKSTDSWCLLGLEAFKNSFIELFP